MVEIAKKRNVAVVGHHGAGKTTLIESILYHTGVIPKMGSVDSGSTFSDYHDDEIAAKHSISTKVMHCNYKGCEIALMDTPGYSDFVGDIRSAIHASDGVLLVLNAQSGVEVETIKIWEYLEEIDIPRLIVVNQMDKERADFKACIQSLKETLDAKVCPIRLPLGSGENFTGVIDLITDKVLKFDNKGGVAKEEDIPQEMHDEEHELRQMMIESAVMNDDALMERYLADERLSFDEIRHGLHDGVLKGDIVPILVSDAHACIGISSLLDGLVNYIPEPEERHTYTAYKKGTTEEYEEDIHEDGPGVGFVFKSIIDPYAGKLAYIHVVSGTFLPDTEWVNRNKDGKEKVHHILSVNGKQTKSVSSATVGDIIAVAKIDSFDTNDTVSTAEGDVLVAPTHFPQPLVYAAIHAKDKNEEDKLGNALHKLISGDSTITVERNTETNENVIRAAGQMQIDLLIKRLNDNYKLEVETTTPKVAYRETITKKGEGKYRHKKQSGGHGQFGEVHMRMEPLERGGDYEFVNNIFGGAIPTKFIPAVEKGVIEARETGVLAGYPVVDVKVDLFDGGYHDVDSSEMAFKIAAVKCFKQTALESCKPILLEPIMNVSVFVPESNMGDVMGDLSTRRGRVQGMEGETSKKTIKAQVPLAEMYSYSYGLRSLTSGLGTFEMEFSHYEQVPSNVAEKVIAEANFVDTDD